MISEETHLMQNAAQGMDDFHPLRRQIFLTIICFSFMVPRTIFDEFRTIREPLHHRVHATNSDSISHTLFNQQIPRRQLLRNTIHASEESI